MGGERWVRWSLRLFPREFRESHLDEMLEFVREERAKPMYASGRWGAVRFWRRTFFDLLGGAIRYRLNERALSGPYSDYPRRLPRGETAMSLLHDVRFAGRALVRAPTVTAMVVTTLALAIGMNTAIFSVVNAVLLRPLDYTAPDELVYLQARWSTDEVDRASHSGGDFTEIRETVTTLRDVAAITTIRQNLTGIDLAEQVRVGWVSTNFFSVLGVNAAVGRRFVAEDPAGTVVISHALWRRAMGADPDVVGRVLQLDGRAHTVVGVMPPTFRIHVPEVTNAIDLWKVPDDWWQNGDIWGSRGVEFGLLQLIGRLQDGYTVAQANEEIGSLAQDFRRRFQDYETAGLEMTAVPLRDGVVSDVRTTLWLLVGAVGFVLLIACGNVMNLLLVRAQHRRRELALRVALGSSRSRVVQLLLAESLVLAFAGGAAGFGLGLVGTDMLARFRPPGVPMLEGLTADATVFAFAAAVALGCTLLVGLLPALTAARRDVASDIYHTGSVGSRSRQRLSRALVVGQISLSLVLLVGAGLLTASLLRLARIEPGFDYENLLTFSISLPGARYEWPEGADRFFRELEDRLDALPGVSSAGVVWPMPMSPNSWSGQYIGGSVDPEARAYAGYRLATADFFPTIGARLITGRGFGTDDPKRVVIVSRNLAERAWPGQPAVGRTLEADPWGGGNAPFEVIGVVENMRFHDLKEEPPEVIYFDSQGWSWTDWEVHAVVRTLTDPNTLVPSVRAELAAMDAQIPMAKVRSMRDYVGDQLASNRFALALIGLFAVVAAVLAAVGLYGVLAFSVSQRSRELGLRMALGSERLGILRLVIGQGLTLTVVGVALGVAGALGVTRLLSSYLFGITPTDPLTFATIAAMLLAVGAAASYLPARRATRLDPMTVLKSD